MNTIPRIRAMSLFDLTDDREARMTTLPLPPVPADDDLRDRIACDHANFERSAASFGDIATGFEISKEDESDISCRTVSSSSRRRRPTTWVPRASCGDVTLRRRDTPLAMPQSTNGDNP